MRRTLAKYLQLVGALLVLSLVVGISTAAQSFAPSSTCKQPYPLCQVRGAPDLHEIATTRLPPERALFFYEQRTASQGNSLGSFTASMIIRADLPDTLQQGEFELRVQYIAPHCLQFTPVRFVGDGFVKHNVISRILQSEVQHAAREDRGNTAIDADNYSFNYKRTELLNSEFVHVYAVKPRQKRLLLFKGEIYIDARTGRLRKAKGTMAKSQSFWVRKLEFVQEYADFEDFTLPVHLHSVAKARIVGKVMVDIVVDKYSLVKLKASNGQP